VGPDPAREGCQERGRRQRQSCHLPARGLKGWGDWPCWYSVATRGRWPRGCVVGGSVSMGRARERVRREGFSSYQRKKGGNASFGVVSPGE
jgi:hypothetical protein